jgi:hypothetical protein
VAEYIVTKVRKELSSDGTREHIEGVCVNGVHYIRKQVVESIAANSVWKTQADGCEAVIEPIAFCSKPRCTATPYIKTNPDSTRRTILRTSIVADNGANPTAAGYGGQHGMTVIDCGCPANVRPDRRHRSQDDEGHLHDGRPRVQHRVTTTEALRPPDSGSVYCVNQDHPQ